MRALWAATIAMCLLVVCARPVDASAQLRDDERLDVAVRPAGVSFTRRSPVVDGHLRPLYVMPAAAAVHDAPLGTPTIIDTAPDAGWQSVLSVPTRSSRGPPQR